MTTVVMQGRKRELASSNGGYSLFVTALVMVVASAFFVSCRVGSRTRAGEFGWDDALVVLALVSLP